MESFKEKFFSELNTTLTGAASLCIKVILALIIFFIGYKLISWVRRIVRKSLVRIDADPGVSGFIDSMIRIGLDILLILGILGWVGVQSATIAAILASAGLALGMALQGSLSNVAGGVLILVLKPFRIGDYIVEDSKKNAGTVKEIGLFYTKLATIDNRIVVLPNGTLANCSITNYTMENTMKLDLTVGISYQADTAKAKGILEDILNNDADTIKKDEMEVFVKELSDSSVVLGFRAWVKGDKYWPTKYRILETVKTRFETEGIQIPYQQIDVHVQDN